jgi:hypothetical protein
MSTSASTSASASGPFNIRDIRDQTPPEIAALLDAQRPGTWESDYIDLIRQEPSLSDFPQDLNQYIDSAIIPPHPTPPPAMWAKREDGSYQPTAAFVQRAERVAARLGALFGGRIDPTVDIATVVWLARAFHFLGNYAREPVALDAVGAAALDWYAKMAAEMLDGLGGGGVGTPARKTEPPSKRVKAEPGFVPSRAKVEEPKAEPVPPAVGPPAAARPPSPPPPPPSLPHPPPPPPGRPPPDRAFRRRLGDMALGRGRSPGTYTWPRSLRLTEAELQDLWAWLTREFAWFDSRAGRPEEAVRKEVEYVFGQSPYFFLKPWDRPDLVFPLRWADQRERAPHAFVDPEYRALKPGPNMAHFVAELEDEFGRRYALGREATSDARVLYYRRGPVRAGHPVPGDSLLLRHVNGLLHPRPCRGHRVAVERTRIMPRAATGIVCIENYSDLVACT